MSTGSTPWGRQRDKRKKYTQRQYKQGRDQKKELESNEKKVHSHGITEDKILQFDNEEEGNTKQKNNNNNKNLCGARSFCQAATIKEKKVRVETVHM